MGINGIGDFIYRETPRYKNGTNICLSHVTNKPYVVERSSLRAGEPIVYTIKLSKNKEDSITHESILPIPGTEMAYTTYNLTTTTNLKVLDVIKPADSSAYRYVCAVKLPNDIVIDFACELSQIIGIFQAISETYVTTEARLNKKEI